MLELRPKYSGLTPRKITSQLFMLHKPLVDASYSPSPTLTIFQGLDCIRDLYVVSEMVSSPACTVGSQPVTIQRVPCLFRFSLDLSCGDNILYRQSLNRSRHLEVSIVGI